MRSYDSTGVDVTFDIPQADLAKYPAGDLNVQIGDMVGVTAGPVDLNDGKLVVSTERVFNRKVTSANGVGIGRKVFLKADGSLTTTEADGPHFGYTLDAIAAGKTADVRVKLVA